MPARSHPHGSARVSTGLALRPLRGRGVCAVLALLMPWLAASGVDVLTQANDTLRTGGNLSETILTTSNVSTATFGKVFTYTVNGQVYAQPLYCSQVAFGGAIGTRNVVIIATENNYLYAFDADNQSVSGAGPLIWYASPTLFGNPAAQGNGSCGDLYPTAGITATPVIDKANGIIYLVAKSFDGTAYHDVMHAISLYTGIELTNWPVAIAGSYNGATFAPQWHQCRPGLLMQSVGGTPTIYAAFTSHCDQGTWQGWIFAVSATETPSISNVYCTCPTYNGGSIWQSGKGLVADAAGNIYCATGNALNAAAIDGSATTTDKAMAVLKLSASLQVKDFFIPSNSVNDNAVDYDLGSGGPLLIPGTSYLVQAGKTGYIYLLDTGNLGGYTPALSGGDNANAYQWFPGLTGSGDSNCQCPIYWNAPAGPHVYYWAGANVIKAFPFSGTALATTPDSQGSVVPVHRQGGISLSANGSISGTGIIWGICSGGSDNNPSGGTGSLPGSLYAYDAENLSAGPLWTSDQNAAGRDTLGNYSKLSYPTPANGRVYVPTRDGASSTTFTSCSVVVYGLLAPWTTMPAALAFTAQPSVCMGLVPISPPIQVSVLDGNGNLVTSATNTVTLSLGANPGAATLAGTLTVSAVNGVATFTGLTISQGGTGYTLVATSMPSAGAFVGTDIGAPAVSGSTTAVTGGFDVVGGGTGIMDPSDQFQFGVLAVSGAFDLQARVNAILDTPPASGPDDALAGLMARSTLGADSDNALALVYPSSVPAHASNTGGYDYQDRDAGITTLLAPSAFTPSATAIPVDYPATWLRLTFDGTVFTGYASVDGSSWTPYATSTPADPGEYLAGCSLGLAVTSASPVTAATAQFRNLSLNGVAWLTPATSAPITVAPPGIVATPVIAPPPRSYSGPVTVSLSDITPGAIITYTLDGTTPTSGSTAYAGPFPVAGTTTVSAIASASQLQSSTVASALYTVTGTAAYGMPSRPPITPISLPASLVTNPPPLLSQTGVFTSVDNPPGTFSSLDSQAPSPGIIPYTVINPLWSDGASKNRFIALPPGGQITFSPTGEWSFPVGTVMIKTFILGATLLETRLILLTGASPNTGYGVTYKWLPDGSDAQLMGSGSPAGLPDGLNETEASGQVWHYPSRTECVTCHTSNAGFVLGPKTRQLNTTFTYPATQVSDNQLRTWNYLQMFTGDIGEANIPGFEQLVAVTDPSTTVLNQVKSYLDANCSYCHRPNGASTAWNGLYDCPLAGMGLVNAVPQKGTLGTPGALLVYPQNTALSVLYARIISLNPAIEMQPLAHNVVDSAAAGVISQWIMSLPADPAPTLSSVQTFTPVIGGSGTTVLINGANLQDTIQVSFNGTATTAVTSNAGGTQLTTTVPAGATTGPITVTTPSGSATSPGAFTISAAGSPPVITSLTPTSGSAGSTVLITGIALSGTTAVLFTGAVAAFSVLSPTAVSATVPPAATTGQVSLITPGGAALSPGTFTVVAVGTAPVITSIAPSSGLPGTSLQITGIDLGGATQVSFNGTTTTALTVNGAGTVITVTIPVGAQNGPLTVTTPQGIAVSPTAFTTATVTTPAAASASSSGHCGGNVLSLLGLLLLVVVLRRMRLRAVGG